MKKLSLFLIPFLFLGCVATKKDVGDIAKKEQRLKKAIVKLIDENSRFHKEIAMQNRIIEEQSKEINEIKTTVLTLKKERTEKIEVKVFAVDKNEFIKDESIVEVVNGRANLRVKPNLNGISKASVSIGTVLESLGKTSSKNPWYKVYYDSQELWIYGKLIKKVK